MQRAKDLYAEVSEDWTGGVKLAVDILTTAVTTAEPSRMPKSGKLSEIVSRCPANAFEDQSYKEILGTLNKVKERLDDLIIICVKRTFFSPEEKTASC